MPRWSDIAVALLRVTAAADVDERESHLPPELAVDGALHERRQVERDPWPGHVRHGAGARQTSARSPPGVCQATPVCRLFQVACVSVKAEVSR